MPGMQIRYEPGDLFTGGETSLSEPHQCFISACQLVLITILISFFIYQFYHMHHNPSTAQPILKTAAADIKDLIKVTGIISAASLLRSGEQESIQQDDLADSNAVTGTTVPQASELLSGLSVFLPLPVQILLPGASFNGSSESHAVAAPTPSAEDHTAAAALPVGAGHIHSTPDTQPGNGTRDLKEEADVRRNESIVHSVLL